MEMVDATYVLNENHNTPVKANIKGDKFNICLLLVLYTLQSVPIGFALGLPIIIQNMYYSTFNDQAKLSFILWPFSVKLLWAPLVDSLFVQKFGRRKSWLVPVQYLLGMFFFIVGFYINEWLVNTNKPNVNALTIMFFTLNFLAATQDIVVDGWALTMLKRENICLAPTCNGAGLSIGVFFGYILPITLASESFCNKWLRISPLPDGIITIQGCLYFWGVMFVIITTLVAIFKSEEDNILTSLTEPNSINFKVIETYILLFRIMKLPNIKKLAVLILTVYISFSAVDAAFKLKLVDAGVTKDEIGAFEILFMVVKIFLPLLINKCSAKDKSMKNYLKMMVYRLIVGVLIALIVYITPYFVEQTAGEVLITYKIILVLMFILHQSLVFVMWFTIMSFFASISDPQIGGTNMTLLSTLSHLGDSGSKTLALWLIDILTFKQCYVDNSKICTHTNDTINNNICSLSHLTCQVYIDGFYIEVFICTIYGFLWYFACRKTIHILQSKSVDEWHVNVITK